MKFIIKVKFRKDKYIITMKIKKNFLPAVSKRGIELILSWDCGIIVITRFAGDPEEDDNNK